MSLTQMVPATAQQVTSGANAAGTITLPAVAGRTYVLRSLVASYVGGTVTGRVTVQDGATTILEYDVTATGPTFPPIPDGGITGTTGQAMTITLAAGGTGVTGRLSISYTI